MRMWGVNPRLLCRKHLLGEHVEMHMFVGTLRAGKSVNGYTSTGLVNLHKIRERHDELAEEMEERGYDHQSPLPSFPMPVVGDKGFVNEVENLKELARRCKDCAERQKGPKTASVEDLQNVGFFEED